MPRIVTSMLRTAALAAGWLLCTLPGPASAGPDAPGRAGGATPGELRFDAYTPLARGSEVARRLLTPLTDDRLHRLMARRGIAMREQAIDLAREHFMLHVPPGSPPPSGYGLLVFVPPWPQAKLPDGWAREFDRRGLIYVSMADAGNAADVIDRRVPLALLAWANVAGRYRLDPSRVYVGGYSGGSRVALRIALGYPDVFRGALLEAGSDPPGSAALSLPPAALFRRFQEDSRLVFLTGGRDAPHRRMDIASGEALRHWCVDDIAEVTPPWLDHAIADAAALGQALDALLRPLPPPGGVLAACRARVTDELASNLAEVREALGHDDPGRAQRQLDAIDRRYGGLAADASRALQAQIDARPP